MNDRLVVVLGSGLFGGSVAAVLALLTWLPVPYTAGVAVGGLAVGAVVGRALLPVERLADRIEHRALVVGTALPLFGLLAWASWVGWQTELGSRYLVGMAGIVLALVGWVTVVQVGQNAQSAAADRRGKTLVELPRTSLTVLPGGSLPGRWSILHPLTGLVGLGTGIWGFLNSGSPFFVVFVLGGLGLLVPDPEYTTRVTDTGLIAENYLGSSVPLGRTFTAWDEVSGYELTDDRLRIAVEMGLDFTYDTADIDDLEQVQKVLDDNAPERC